MDGIARYRDRFALVTGAGRGIGAAVAARLAAEGVRLILTARSEERLKAFHRTLPAPESHAVIAADLTVDADLVRLTSAVAEIVGGEGLALFVCNAGTAIHATVEETTTEVWDRIFQVNARAPFILSRDLLPLLEKVPGRIVFVASVVSTQGYVHQSAYTASKHALHGFTKVLAKEVADRGIIVHSVQPGGVNTRMVRETRPDIDGSELIQPEDVAEAIVNLISLDGNAIIDEIRIRRRTKTPF